jgi:hypothetical protein
VHSFETKYTEDLRILYYVYLAPLEIHLDSWLNQDPSNIQTQRKWRLFKQYSKAVHALYQMHSSGLEG